MTSLLVLTQDSHILMPLRESDPSSVLMDDAALKRLNMAVGLAGMLPYRRPLQALM